MAAFIHPTHPVFWCKADIVGEFAAQFEQKTMVEALRFFSEPATCVKYLAASTPFE
jgi:hypothetical protein